jgi:hypothetical protein
VFRPGARAASGGDDDGYDLACLFLHGGMA